MSVRSSAIWNLEVLVFKERGKLEYQEKNLMEQGREQQQISTIFTTFQATIFTSLALPRAFHACNREACLSYTLFYHNIFLKLIVTSWLRS